MPAAPASSVPERSRSPLPPARRRGPHSPRSPRRCANVLVDAHCHLGDAAFDRDRDAVLVRARAAGVGHVVVIGGTVAESERAAALARGGARLSGPPRGHPPPGRAPAPGAAGPPQAPPPPPQKGGGWGS